LTFF